MLGKLGAGALRVFQLIFAVVVLGLSINAVRWQYYNAVPATNGFGAFAGAFGVLAGLMGFAAIWISSIAGVVMSVIDGFSTCFFFAGGLAFALGLRGVNCSDGNDPGTWHNKLISGGCNLVGGGSTWQCGFYQNSDVEHRCRLAEADTAFLFLGFIASLVAAGLSAYSARSKKKGNSVV